MGERVRVVRHDGRLVAVKEAGPDGPDGLRAEAEVLRCVQGPGVVELVGLRAGEPAALITAWVGARSLADVGGTLAPRQAAALCLAVAGSVGRLHRAGVVHAAVEPAHVLLDAHGRPVLCGFGSSGPIGAPVRRPATDRSGTAPGDRPDRASVLRPTLDVAGLGALLTHLLGPAPAGGLGREPRRNLAEWRALTAAARHASGTDTSARPSLAAFVRAVRKAAPEAHLSADALPDDDTGRADDRSTGPRPGAVPPRPSRSGERRRPGAGPPPAPRRRSGALPAALAVLAVAATSYFGLSAWWSPSPESASASASRAGSTTPTPAPTPTSRAPAATTTTAGDTSDAGRGGAVVLEHDGRRYSVGAEGDVVLVGPWRCDGRPIAAVLRDDGSVHLFDSWASPGADLTARQVGLVAGATRLDTAADGPGCAALVIGDDAGTLSTLTAEDLL